MSESTYFLDLGKSTAIQLINNRLNNLDTATRRFPASANLAAEYTERFAILKSNDVSTYDKAEYIVHENVNEDSALVSAAFVDERGRTDWTNTTVKLKYTKYGTKKFDATLYIDIRMSPGLISGNYACVFRIPLSIVKGCKESSVTASIDQGESGNQIKYLQLKTVNGVRYLRLSSSAVSSSSYMRSTGLVITFSGEFTEE